MNGGYISGLAVKTAEISASGTIARDVVSVACINQSEITLTLPTMQPYDDGHVVKIRNINGAKVNVKPGYGYQIAYSAGRYTTTYKSTYIHADRGKISRHQVPTVWPITVRLRNSSTTVI